MRTGPIVITRGVAALRQDPIYETWLNVCLQRYNSGDWGDLCQEDQQLNDQAIKQGGRILARYNNSAGDVYIITDGGGTTVLLTDEY